MTCIRCFCPTFRYERTNENLTELALSGAGKPVFLHTDWCETADCKSSAFNNHSPLIQYNTETNEWDILARQDKTKTKKSMSSYLKALASGKLEPSTQALSPNFGDLPSKKLPPPSVKTQTCRECGTTFIPGLNHTGFINVCVDCAADS